VLAVGYLLGLVAAALAMRLVGERHWITATLLYLPRAGFALPLPFVVLALALFGPRRLLWGLPVALGLILFPLMGLETGGVGLLGRARAAERPALRILSYNIATVSEPERLADVIRDTDPDLVVFQEYRTDVEGALADVLRGFHRHADGQFAVASRYPLGDVYLPPKIPLPGSEPRSSRFVRYRVQGPFGPVTLLNVHPVSPRNGMEEARGIGLLHELRRGRIGRAEVVATIEGNAALRLRQAEEIATEAGRSPDPVIIAGDTNMPGLSWTLARTLGRYVDGFSAAGAGFGYTFPASHPWMRIDRILADERLVFRRFEVLPATASDHLAVLAEIAGPRGASLEPSR
jgi:vancomycin resistance protein VanJ